MALPPVVRLLAALAVPLLLPACAMHQTATDWHGHVGADGEPVFVQTSTFWGLNLAIAAPLAGKTTIDEMVAAATAEIRLQDGDRLRVVETESNNYWWGVPPLSWLFSPVLTSISIEYRPTAEAIAAAAARRGESVPAAPAPR